MLATRFKLPPWVIEAGLALLVIVGFALWERHQGAASCRRADAALVKEQIAHNRDLKAQGTTTVFQEAHDYHDAIAAPIARPVRLRVCPPGREVPRAGSAGQISDGPSPIREPDHPEAVPSESTGPELQMIGRQADAQVRELQHYILNVCSKR
jgi:hypothetical protein